MTTDVERVSATIYHFPVNTPHRRTGSDKKPTENPASDIAVDTCWYHEEAVHESNERQRGD